MYYNYYTIGGELYHHGVQGQKWGKRNGPPYPLGSDVSTGKRLKNTVFISGSSKTQTKDSPYYRRKLPSTVTEKIDEMIKNGDTIIVGDAPGIDRQVQNYLKKKRYNNVEIYGPGKEVRYSANKKWKTNPIDDPDHEPGSSEWLAKKDIAMSDRANKGMAIILDEGAKATRRNIDRLIDNMKDVDIYQLNKDKNDDWVLKEKYVQSKVDEIDKEIAEEKSRKKKLQRDLKKASNAIEQDKIYDVIDACDLYLEELKKRKKKIRR